MPWFFLLYLFSFKAHPVAPQVVMPPTVQASGPCIFTYAPSPTGKGSVAVSYVC